MVRTNDLNQKGVERDQVHQVSVLRDRQDGFVTLDVAMKAGESVVFRHSPHWTSPIVRKLQHTRVMPRLACFGLDAFAACSAIAFGIARPSASGKSCACDTIIFASRQVFATAVGQTALQAVVFQYQQLTGRATLEVCINSNHPTTIDRDDFISRGMANKSGRKGVV